MNGFFDTKGDHPFGARETLGVLWIPEGFGFAGQLQCVARLKIDKQQAASWVDQKVAQCIEHTVPRVIGEK